MKSFKVLVDGQYKEAYFKEEVDATLERLRVELKSAFLARQSREHCKLKGNQSRKHIDILDDVMDKIDDKFIEVQHETKIQEV